MEVNIIKLEDGKNYLIVDTIECNEQKYIVMGSEDNPDDIVFRKVVFENDKEWLEKIDNYEEFEKCMLNYAKKYRIEGEKNEE